MYASQHCSRRGGHFDRSMKLGTTIIGQATDDIIDKGLGTARFL